MFCVRGFGGWLGFLLCGGCSGCPPGFLVLGFGVVRCSCSSWFFCAVVRGCGGRVAGGSGSGGRCGAPGLHRLSSVGGGWACWARLSRECFAGVGLRPVLLRLVGWWGVGRVFSARRSLVLRFRCWSSWSCRGWGFGGCRVGLGFFLRLLLFGPGLFGLGLFGFCLESLILAQDERWRRA